MGVLILVICDLIHTQEKVNISNAFTSIDQSKGGGH